MQNGVRVQRLKTCFKVRGLMGGMKFWFDFTLFKLYAVVNYVEGINVVDFITE